jgi:hypothetical protein
MKIKIYEPQSNSFPDFVEEFLEILDKISQRYKDCRTAQVLLKTIVEIVHIGCIMHKDSFTEPKGIRKRWILRIGKNW